MVVTLEQIQVGVLKYVETEIAAKATGLTKFMVYFALPSLPKMIAEKLLQAKESPLFADIFDENGNVKLAEARTRALEALKRSGKLYIKEIGYFVDETDVELIYKYIGG